MARPIHVAMNALSPAPGAPMRGAPRCPKMNIQQRNTFATFITIAATKWTCVRPMPSKNALMAIVEAIEMTASMRQRVYEMATSWTCGTSIMARASQGRVRRPTTEKAAPATTAKNVALAITEPAAWRSPSAYRRATSACVPTLMAPRLPPKSHVSMSDGSRAAWAYDDSGTGR